MKVDDTIVEPKEIPKEIIYEKFIPGVLHVQLVGWYYDKHRRKLPMPVKIDKNTGAILVKPIGEIGGGVPSEIITRLDQIIENTGNIKIDAESVNLNVDELEEKTLTRILPRFNSFPQNSYPAGATLTLSVADLVGEGGRCYGVTIFNNSTTERIGINFDADATEDNHIPLNPGDIIGISAELTNKLSIYFPDGYETVKNLHIIPETNGVRSTQGRQQVQPQGGHVRPM